MAWRSSRNYPADDRKRCQYSMKEALSRVDSVASHEERATQNDPTDPNPNRNIDCLFSLDRQHQRADFGFLVILSVAERSVHQSQYAGNEKHHSQHLYRIHMLSSPNRIKELGDLESREPV